VRELDLLRRVRPARLAPVRAREVPLVRLRRVRVVLLRPRLLLLRVPAVRPRLVLRALPVRLRVPLLLLERLLPVRLVLVRVRPLPDRVPARLVRPRVLLRPLLLERLLVRLLEELLPPVRRLREDEPRSGTLAPLSRASESPMATACFRLVTRRPLLPLRSVPCLRFLMARSTDSPEASP